MSSQNLPGQAERVIAYVDGFNLYFGLMAARLSQFRWLDVQALANRLLLPHQQLVTVKYFTARITGRDRNKIARQNALLRALEARPQLEIVYGRYLKKDDHHCHRCGNRWPQYEEKMTDVNIAAHMSSDAHLDRFDTALLVSGDSDLSMAVSMIRADTGKRVVAVFPPKRESVDLKKVVDAHLKLNRTYIGKSLLEDPVLLPDGTPLACPNEWK